MTYDECLEISRKTSDYYKKEYTVLMRSQDIPMNKLLKIFPKKFKTQIKKILSFFLPKHFG